MSRKKRAIEKQKKQNSAKKNAKRAKKNYYSSYEAKLKWENKKSRRDQVKRNQRESKGISTLCPLASWEEPNSEKCSNCSLVCSFKY